MASHRILAISDLHLKKSWNYKPVVDEIVRIVDRERPDLVVFLCDTLDTKSVIHQTCLVDAVNLFTTVADMAETVVLINTGHGCLTGNIYGNNLGPGIVGI